MAFVKNLLPLLALWVLPAGSYARQARPADPYAYLTQDSHFPLTVSLFEFHSAFWINLHHFLLLQAQPNAPHRNPTSEGPLSKEEQQRWDAAVTYYQKNLIGHSVIFDDEMIAIDSALARSENAPAVDTTDKALPPDLGKVLNAASPIYRKHWWPAHDLANRLWIVSAEPLVRTFGPRLQDQLSAAYGTSWYPGFIRVDVCNWAGPMLAGYTTGSAHGHIILPSSDVRVQGFASLETLFHEAGHTIVGPWAGTISQAIAAAARARNIPEPEDLWHALMFYTTGELVRRDLEELGYLSYEPYADKYDLWRGPWRNYRGVLSVFWRLHLDGKLSIDQAMAKMMDVLALDANRGASMQRPQRQSKATPRKSPGRSRIIA
ncbi:MAG TPA: hypothetical protein VFA07_13290 [Chthonomonadaceae bacterium]|nr:hypothetical protein [Chthonomonadaceae bacterium]